MNDLENYQVALNECFGPSSAKFDTSSGVTNNIIAALNCTNFPSFRTTFLNRCGRLAARYPAADANRKPLLNRLNEMASKTKCDGVYAEMVALDYLNSNEDLLSSCITLSRRVPASDTLASALNGGDPDYDGYYDDFNVFFDVKVLGDKSRKILDGIINDAKRELRIPNVTISPEYPLDSEFDLFEQNRLKLLKELVASISIESKTRIVKSAIIPELNFKLLWESGVQVTFGTYDPFWHAENHHRLPFKYINKFSTVAPSVIVFVVFPWFSENVVNEFCSKEIFYRSLCRRFFCQYAKDHTQAKSILKGFHGTRTLSEVTEKLSGVLILEDKSLTAEDPTAQNVNGYAYLNPNAHHKVSRQFMNYLSSLRFIVDDFAHDNY